jgi:hypothetical protein
VAGRGKSASSAPYGNFHLHGRFAHVHKNIDGSDEERYSDRYRYLEWEGRRQLLSQCRTGRRKMAVKRKGAAN